MAVHEDLAAIVTTATKMPVDENAPGMLCKLSRKTSASGWDGREVVVPKVALFEAKPLVGRSEVRLWWHVSVGRSR
jgi:hypothetical protein